MYKSVIFLPQREVIKLHPDSATVLISLIFPDVVLGFDPGYLDVLQLAFNDISEKKINVRVGTIPDEAEGPIVQEYNGEKYVWPDAHHTYSIKSFLAKHEGDRRQERKIIVHCSAGISRSAAVAAFAVHKYGILLLNGEPSFKEQVAMTNTSMANPRLLRLLMKG
jgi:predicted protein tyrosine phosphatase